MLIGSYNYGLVGLSVAIAIMAAYTALDLAGRVNAYRGSARLWWLAGGAAAMGSGIWSMHYIGMLALRIPILIAYDLPTVGLSMVAAWAASLIALYTVSRPRMSWIAVGVGSIFMGSGIASMHYIGMFAMRMSACVRYNRGIVALSVAAAIVISAVALVLSYWLRNEARNSRRKILSALVMGSAIPVMHYLGMWAASFSTACHIIPDTSRAFEISTLGIVVIAIVTVAMLITVIITSFLDRLLEARRSSLAQAHENEAHFRLLAEAIPGMIWTALGDGTVNYYNRRWYDFTGQEAGETPPPWRVAIHPEDLQECERLWKISLQHGQTCECECRLREAKGDFRWHLLRAVPLRQDDGPVTRWFGTFTDIEHQKRNQELLQDQVRERTGEILAINERLQAEMENRETAQKSYAAETGRLLENLRQTSVKSSLLRRMGFLLQSCTGRDEALPLVSGFAPKLFPEYSGAICLLNSSKSFLEVAGVWGGCELPSALSEPDSCWALRTSRVHAVEAGDQSAPCRHAQGVSRSYFCIPILANGEAIGILHLQHSQQAETAAENSVSLPSTFAEHIGLSMANLRLRELLRNQSIRDPLTGLFNRRYLEETFDREYLRAQREDKSVGLMMLDIDHFKDFNDTFGHDAGDLVLREFSAMLSASVRAGDLVSRYGGEEFVLLLPGMTIEQTRQRGERIRQRVKEIKLHFQSKPLGGISVSVGVAAAPLQGTSFKHVVAAADKALYAAKKDGRDRVMAAEERSSRMAEPAIAVALDAEV